MIRRTENEQRTGLIKHVPPRLLLVCGKSANCRGLPVFPSLSFAEWTASTWLLAVPSCE